MDFQKKLELIKAVSLLADFWGVEPADLLCVVAFTKPQKKEEWNEIATEVKDFTNMDIAGRAKKLGLSLSFGQG